MGNLTVEVATKQSVICAQCGVTILPTPMGYVGGTGYAVKDNGDKICYECCAVNDREYMRTHGKITLYLSKMSEYDPKLRTIWEITNWPGSLRFPVREIRESWHNMARIRYDVWFVFNNHVWHGQRYGDYGELCHCKQTKQVWNQLLHG